MEILPNFLIIGAAKSGTSSLHNYIKEHPEIFMSYPKEPKFITSTFVKFPMNGPGDDIIERNLITKDFESYKNLFSGISTEKAYGESSAETLYYHEKSIPAIKQYFTNEPKIIIILRNPIERAYSAYTYIVSELREDLTFREALNAEDERIKNNYEYLWYYKDVGLYYEQVKDFLENFDDVKVYLFEDLKSNPKTLLKSLFAFLGVDTEFLPDNLNEKYNISGIPKYYYLQNFLKKKNIVKDILKLVIPNTLRRKIVSRIDKSTLQKVPMSTEEREYLIDYYRDDINKLQKLIDRDLSHWMS